VGLNQLSNQSLVSSRIKRIIRPIKEPRKKAKIKNYKGLHIRTIGLVKGAKVKGAQSATSFLV
jgi:hypothetical protein